jgi:hypothetical protein
MDIDSMGRIFLVTPTDAFIGNCATSKVRIGMASEYASIHYVSIAEKKVKTYTNSRE